LSPGFRTDAGLYVVKTRLPSRDPAQKKLNSASARSPAVSLRCLWARYASAGRTVALKLLPMGMPNDRGGEDHTIQRSRSLIIHFRIGEGRSGRCRDWNTVPSQKDLGDALGPTRCLSPRRCIVAYWGQSSPHQRFIQLVFRDLKFFAASANVGAPVDDSIVNIALAIL